MSSSLIPKSLIIYKGANCDIPNHPRARKYGLQLSFTRSNHSCFWNPQKLRILRGPVKKRLTSMWFEYRFGQNHNDLIKDVKKIPEIRRLKMSFYGNAGPRFYKSESSLNSQNTVDTDEDAEPENELDLLLDDNQQDRRDVKQIFKQAKGLTSFDFKFQFIYPYHYKVFNSFSLFTKLENCKMKIQIRHPNELIGLRDLLKAAKQRGYWPNIKSMSIKLRHSYNKENCTPRFIRFCTILQEITKTAQDLPWVKIQLKVKYLWRQDESAVAILQETVEKAQNQLVGLSLVTDQPKRLTQFFTTVDKLKNLQKFSVRFNEPPNLQNEEAILESLKKLPLLKQFKVQGREILDSEQNSKFVENLGYLSHLTSFSFKGRNQAINKTLWSNLSSSILKLPQLQVLVLKTSVFQASEISPDLNSFLEFFAGLKNFHSLQTFIFDMDYHSKGKVSDGPVIFQAVCEALQNQRDLRKLHFNYPWIPKMNSDLQELTKALSKLQKLQDFDFDIQNWNWIEPVENDIFLEFAKVVSCLKEVQRFTTRLEMKEVSDLTYEAAQLLFKCFKQRKAHLSVILGSEQVDGEAYEKIGSLSPEIYISRVEKEEMRSLYDPVEEEF